MSLLIPSKRCCDQLKRYARYTLCVNDTTRTHRYRIYSVRDVTICKVLKAVIVNVYEQWHANNLASIDGAKSR